MLRFIRHQYWVTQEFFRRHFRLIFRTVTLVVVGSLVITLVLRYLPTPRPQTRIGLVGKYTPETLPLEIRELISIGLVVLDAKGDPQPALADSWSIEEDGHLYRFHLDPTKRWHQDGFVQPDDLQYHFADVVVEPGENSLIFHLKDPFAPFFSAVSRPVLKDGRYGVGEYTLASSSVYAGILQSITLLSSSRKLVYKFYPTENSALTAFRLGELDTLRQLSFIPEDLVQDSRIVISQNENDLKLAVLFFNNRDNLLLNKPTRQALAYAIADKSFGFRRALGPVPESSWAFNPLVKSYEFDPERARTLLKQDFPDPSALSLELKTTLQYLSQAEQIADNWREHLGIKVTVKVVTSLSSDYQVFLADFTPPLDPDQYTTWHSTQPTNYTNYTNLKVDKLLEDGRRTLDKKLRKEIYQDFQRFLLEDAPAVFLFYSRSFDLSRKPLFVD